MSKKDFFPSKFWWRNAFLFSIGLIFIFLTGSGGRLDKDAEVQKIFALRNNDEWKAVWHTERHTKCLHQLVNHMDWACKVDVYRVQKKDEVLDQVPEHLTLDPALAHTVIKPWSGYIQRRKRSITQECCSATGCTWEEYAEYCPGHHRISGR